MGFVEELGKLGDNIRSSFDARVSFLGQNISDTRKLMSLFNRNHKAMGRKLRADLGVFVDDLSETVDSLRQKFQRQQKAVHQECKSAHQSWQNTSKTMASKRGNFKRDLSKATQSHFSKATQIHSKGH